MLGERMKIEDVAYLSPYTDVFGRVWRGTTFTVVAEVGGKEHKVPFARAVTDTFGHIELEQRLRETDPWRQLSRTISALAPNVPNGEEHTA